jgi:O-antigen ligase
MTRRLTGSLLALLFALPVFSCCYAWDVPGWIKSMSVGLVIISLARPAWGLLVTIGLLPVATILQSGIVPFYSFGAYLATGTAPAFPAPFSRAEMAELLTVSFLAGAYARSARLDVRVPSILAKPAGVLAVLIAAGCVVGLYVDQQGTAFPAVYVRQLYRHLLENYFGDQTTFAPLHSATVWMEALALAVAAERVLRADATVQGPVVRTLIVGAIASAAFSWNRVAEVWVRSQLSMRTLVEYVTTNRFTPLYTDPNAAGSLYALWLVFAASLALSGAAWTWLAVVMLGLAIWVTHSRSAEAATLAGIAVIWLSARKVSKLYVGLALAATLALGIVIALRSPVTRAQSSSAVSLGVRWEMTKIGLRLAASHPIFGIGLGRFRVSSRDLIPADLRTIFPQSQGGENAHNNFVQILAELGVVGVAAFLWLLVAAGRAVVASWRSDRAGPALVGMSGGLCAFLLSCLTGHPLLITEILLLFFLALGVAAGLAMPPTSPATFSRRGAIVSIAIILATLPVRVRQAGREMDLDHVVIGASGIAGREDGIRYRIAEAHSRWFVASSVRHLQIPVRAAGDAPDLCLVQVSIDGKLVNQLQATHAAWRDIDLLLDPGRRPPVSRAVDLRVPNAQCRLMVGDFRNRD